MDLYDIRNQLNSGKSIYDIPMRVTFYARVSTDKDEQLHSLSAQVSYYSDFIRANPGWELVDGYIDEGLSGTSVGKRESFLKMIGDARQKRFDFIVTKEISRFSRNTLDSIKYTQELLGCGVGILFQSDNINTLYPDAELRLTIMSSIAQDEVRKISERVRFGFKRAIDSGVVLGNNRIWGYTKDNGRLVIDEDEAGMVRSIFDLYANEGIGIRGICARLADMGYKNGNGNDFSFSTIRGILANPKYKGYYCGNKTHKYDYRRNDRRRMETAEWIMYKNEESVPPIVGEELWDRANRILNRRSEKMSAGDKTSYQNKYPYSGKIICAEHNTPYYRVEYRYKSGTKEGWKCRRYQEKGVEGCAGPIVYTGEIDGMVRQLLDISAADRERLANDLFKIYSDISITSSIRGDITELKAETDGIMAMKNKLLDLNVKGKITDDEFETRNNAFNGEMEILRARISCLERQDERNDGFADRTESLRGAIAAEFSFEEGIGEGIIGHLIEKIEVHETDVKNTVRLKVFQKEVDLPADYEIVRRRNRAPEIRAVLTSVCCGQYI